MLRDDEHVFLLSFVFHSSGGTNCWCFISVPSSVTAFLLECCQFISPCYFIIFFLVLSTICQALQNDLVLVCSMIKIHNPEFCNCINRDSCVKTQMTAI